MEHGDDSSNSCYMSDYLLPLSLPPFTFNTILSFHPFYDFTPNNEQLTNSKYKTFAKEGKAVPAIMIMAVPF